MRPRREEEPITADTNLHWIIDSSQEGIMALSREWHIIYLNPAAKKLINSQHASLIGKNIWQEFPEAIDSPVYHALQQAVEVQQSHYVEAYSKLLNRWAEFAIYPSLTGLFVHFHTVASRKGSGTATQNDDSYRLLLDRLTDGFIALDNNFCYTYANQKIGALLRRDPESLIGKNVWDEFPDAVDSYTYKAFHTAMKEQRFISNVDYFEPLDLWQENYIYPSPAGLSVFIKDVTEQKKMEQELQEQQRQLQLQTITAALEAQEQERTYIGRELHDNINQVLTATQLILSLAKEHPENAGSMIDKCIANLERAINENRSLAHELVTPHFEEGSLVEEISNLLQSMMDAKGIKTIVDADSFDEDLLTERQKLAVYRMVQEQCTNITKHAGAAAASIQLHTSDTVCTIVIADDGKGSSKPKMAKGIGLRNIESRLHLFNGSLEVVNEPGKGFALHISLPLA